MLTPQSGCAPTKTSNTATTVRIAELMDNSAGPVPYLGALSDNSCARDEAGRLVYTSICREKQWRKIAIAAQLGRYLRMIMNLNQNRLLTMIPRTLNGP